MKRLLLKKSHVAKADTMGVLKRILWQPPGILNWLLEQSFTLDMFLSKFIELPFGTSLIVSARKAV